METRELQFVVGNAQQITQPSYLLAIETDFIDKSRLRDKIITKPNAVAQNKPEPEQIAKLLKSNTVFIVDTKWTRIEKYCVIIFALICLFIAIFSGITITLLGRGSGFKTDYHKYKDLPASICLGGPNITNVWYSVPYSFNTTPTYTPARATYQTYGYLANGSLVPVVGEIPNKLEKMGHVDIPCGNCAGTRPRCAYKSCSSCQCQYRLGDLQIVIIKLQGQLNFTCVIDDNTGTIFSLVPSTDKLNYMYRNQQAGIITLAVGISVAVLASVVSYWKMCYIIK